MKCIACVLCLLSMGSGSEDESKCQNYKNLNSKLISNKNETEGVELEMKSEIIEMNEQ